MPSIEPTAASPPGPAPKAVVYLDLTHLGRHVTGLERIAIELFEKATLRGAEVRPVRSSGGTVSMVLRQQVLLPLLALIHPGAHFIFPGFPPSPLFLLAPRRTIMYVHDLFLIQRPQDLATKARLYMALPFRLAVTRLTRFLANSEKTRSELAAVARPGATIALYRPAVGNVFGLAPRADRQPAKARSGIGMAAGRAPLRLVALGTVEPRKHYAAAAAIVDRLAALGYPDVTLDIIGRSGWGGEAERLAANPRVRLRGYLDVAEAKAVIESADLYLCTSHDEGLGLPLLEVQFAGLPVTAPDAPVFREVLGTSGTFIDPGNPDDAARRIAAALGDAAWLETAGERALANVGRWNAAAATDAASVAALFAPATPAGGSGRDGAGRPAVI